MIKDLEEAMYYCTITKAMEEGSKYDKEKEHYYTDTMRYMPEPMYYREGTGNRMYYSGNNGNRSGSNNNHSNSSGNNGSSQYHE
jgi:hypothetical protein